MFTLWNVKAVVFANESSMCFLPTRGVPVLYVLPRVHSRGENLLEPPTFGVIDAILYHSTVVACHDNPIDREKEVLR